MNNGFAGGETVDQCIESVQVKMSTGFFDKFSSEKSWGYLFDAFR